MSEIGQGGKSTAQSPFAHSADENPLAPPYRIENVAGELGARTAPVRRLLLINGVMLMSGRSMLSMQTA